MVHFWYLTSTSIGVVFSDIRILRKYFLNILPRNNNLIFKLQRQINTCKSVVMK